MKKLVFLILYLAGIHADEVTIINPVKFLSATHSISIVPGRPGVPFSYKIVNLLGEFPYTMGIYEKGPVNIESCEDLSKYDLRKIKKIPYTDHQWLLTQKRACDTVKAINFNDIEMITIIKDPAKLIASKDYLQFRKRQMEEIIKHIGLKVDLKSFECDKNLDKDYLGCRVQDNEHTAFLQDVLKIGEHKYYVSFEYLITGSPRTTSYWLFVFEDGKIVEATNY